MQIAVFVVGAPLEQSELASFNDICLRSRPGKETQTFVQELHRVNCSVIDVQGRNQSGDRGDVRPNDCNITCRISFSH
jgi:hypothetical protein